MTAAAITAVRGRRVWDSRGRPTVEVEVELACGARGRAIAPAGASTGAREAIDLRDGGAKLRGLGVSRALAGIAEIADALRGLDAQDQAAVDAAIIALDGTVNKSRLGGNATVAASLAVLHAAAAHAGRPLWRHIADYYACAPSLPLPEIQIFGGGAHAGRRVDIQDFMVMAPGAESFAEALEIAAEIYRAAGDIMAERGRRFGVADEGGWWPAFDSNEQALETLIAAIERAGEAPGERVVISLDVAANQFRHGGGLSRHPRSLLSGGGDGDRDRDGDRDHDGDGVRHGDDGDGAHDGDSYRLALERRELNRAQLMQLIGEWLARYPIAAVEDPLAEDDEAGWRAFTRRHGDDVLVIGDDFLATNAARIADAAATGACNAALIKPNQTGTVSDAVAALQRARAAGWRAIISARSGESEDVSVAHLAVGLGCGALKVGAFARSERMAKWNEVLRIESAADAPRFAAGDALVDAWWGKRR